MRTPPDLTTIFDSPVKARVRTAVMRGIARTGLTLQPLDDTASFVDDDTTKLPELVARFDAIPGFIPQRRLFHLYLLAFGGVRGDVVEIGSWQGKSTAYLAQACADSRNGVVHAVDTFQGNPGFEERYKVEGSLESLEDSFRANIDRVDLADYVRVHAGRSVDVAAEVAADVKDGVRLLFIDGEHTKQAVTDDLENYTKLVLPGGLIVFDDYSPQFDGDVAAVREHLETHPGWYGRGFQQKNMLVLPRV